MKSLWIIDYENAQWCGGQLNVVVWAESADEAIYLAGDHMDEEQRELFSDHYAEEDEDDDCPTSVSSVKAFNETHDEWEFYKDPAQSSFYPVIGKP